MKLHNARTLSRCTKIIKLTQARSFPDLYAFVFWHRCHVIAYVFEWKWCDVAKVTPNESFVGFARNVQNAKISLKSRGRSPSFSGLPYIWLLLLGCGLLQILVKGFYGSLGILQLKTTNFDTNVWWQAGYQISLDSFKKKEQKVKSSWIQEESMMFTTPSLPFQ